ncbi:hypothetical protein ACFWPK_28265 [Nocardia sp. NPDC058519]|uniref:hypothetical protein n=1 Tax=Nocardia sp. NPDC058519 TaxID=3346535 RepID=UPI0036538D4E
MAIALTSETQHGITIYPDREAWYRLDRTPGVVNVSPHPEADHRDLASKDAALTANGYTFDGDWQPTAIVGEGHLGFYRTVSK